MKNVIYIQIILFSVFSFCCLNAKEQENISMKNISIPINGKKVEFTLFRSSMPMPPLNSKQLSEMGVVPNSMAMAFLLEREQKNKELIWLNYINPDQRYVMLHSIYPEVWCANAEYFEDEKNIFLVVSKTFGLEISISIFQVSPQAKMITEFPIDENKASLYWNNNSVPIANITKKSDLIVTKLEIISKNGFLIVSCSGSNNKNRLEFIYDFKNKTFKEK